MDKIVLQGVEIYGRHGVGSAEKTNDRPFVFDVQLETDLSKAGRSDNLADTVSYADVNDLMTRIVQGRSFNLLERLADALCTAILQTYPAVRSVRLRVKKPRAPMRGNFKWVGVDIERSRTSA